MSDAGLIRASELARAFHEAIDRACKTDAVLHGKMTDSFTQEEILQLQEYQIRQMGTDTGREDKNSAQFMQTSIRNAEMLAGVVMRVMPPGHAVRYIPAQFRTEADAGFLRASKAQKIAVLCTYGLA